MYKPNLTIRLLKLIQEITCEFDVDYLYRKIYTDVNVSPRTRKNRKQRIISSLKVLQAENYILIEKKLTSKNTFKYIIKWQNS